jgi:hypothetical protein
MARDVALVVAADTRDATLGVVVPPRVESGRATTRLPRGPAVRVEAIGQTHLTLGSAAATAT